MILLLNILIFEWTILPNSSLCICRLISLKYGKLNAGEFVLYSGNVLTSSNSNLGKISLVIILSLHKADICFLNLRLPFKSMLFLIFILVTSVEISYPLKFRKIAFERTTKRGRKLSFFYRFGKLNSIFFYNLNIYFLIHLKVILARFKVKD